MKKTQKLRKMVTAGILTFFIICTNMGGYNSHISQAAESSKSKVAFIELGEKGNATLVETEIGGQKRYGLIDAGSSTAYSKYVAKYLRENTDLSKEKRQALDFIIVSHIDVDHAGGVAGSADNGTQGVMGEFCDSSTTLYIKDASTMPAGNSLTRYNNIIKSAKALGMPIGKIKPKAAFNKSIDTVEDIKALNKTDQYDKLRTKLDIFTKRSDGTYSNSGNEVQEGISFGEFYITLYNGQNWNKTNVVKNNLGSDDWDENVNSVTTLLKYTGSNGKVYRTYLGADLGENSKGQYSQAIAEVAANALGTPVSVYQVAHHGFYNSMNAATAAKLNFKYAIVTTSYDEIAKKGIAKAYNSEGITDHTKALTFATNTLKAFLPLENLQKVYFTGGRNYGKPSTDNTAYRVINALKSKVDYLDDNSDNQDTILDGNIVVHFGSSLSITQSSVN